MLVDYIIPRDERSGSATDAKVPEYMDFLLAEKDANANDAGRDARRARLARHRVPEAISEDVHRRDRRAAPRRCSTTSRIRRRRKPGMSYGVAFFNRFRDMTASGFFSSAIGWKDLQYIGNVVQPRLRRLSARRARRSSA